MAQSVPKISIVIPACEMGGKGAEFLSRSLLAIDAQSFKEFEVVITDDSRDTAIQDIADDFWDFEVKYYVNSTPLKMAGNSNEAIKKCSGEIIKVLYLDDFLAHPNSLNDIVSNWRGGWMVTGCIHDDGQRRFNPHYPIYTDEVGKGINTIGSPSVLAFENNHPLLFDESMTWLLDCDLYRRLYDRYGPPTILNDLNVVMGIGDHQMTNILSDDLKLKEQEYIHKKYG